MSSHGKIIVFNRSRTVHDFRAGTTVHQGCLQPYRGMVLAILEGFQPRGGSTFHRCRTRQGRLRPNRPIDDSAGGESDHDQHLRPCH